MKDESKTKKKDSSDEKYKHLIENINAGIYSNTPGPKGKFIEANPAIIQMFRYDNKMDFLKINVSDLYQNPEDRERFNQKMLENKYVKNEELQLKRKNGSTFWGSISAVAATDKKGTIKHYDGTIVDISERKKMEQKLKEKEAFYFTLFQHAPQNSLVVDREGKIIKTNMKKRKSGSRLPNLGDVMYRDYAPKHKIDMYGELMGCIKSGKTKKFPEQPYGKKTLAIVIAPFSEGAIINSQDITARKQVEKELNKTKERLELAMDAGEHAFWDWNIDTDDVYFSPRYYTMLGYKPGELPMKLTTWVELMHPDDRERVVPKVIKWAENAQPYEIEFRLKTKNGKWKWISGRGKSFEKDKKDLPHRAVGVHVDISKYKLAEEKIEKSLKEKTVLLQEIHHRVKNNLQIVASLLNLQSRHIKDKEALEIFQAARKRVFSMALVHERLYKSEDFASIDFRKYIEEMTVHLLSFHLDKMEKIKFEKDIEKTIIDISKAIPLGLILNELITNALKHAFPKNREGKIKIKFNKKGSRYDLIISDDGIGFPKDLDFRKAESMGLTLITSLVNQLNGEIELDRSKGTSYKIKFSD